MITIKGHSNDRVEVQVISVTVECKCPNPECGKKLFIEMGNETKKVECSGCGYEFSIEVGAGEKGTAVDVLKKTVEVFKKNRPWFESKGRPVMPITALTSLSEAELDEIDFSTSVSGSTLKRVMRLMKKRISELCLENKRVKELSARGPIVERSSTSRVSSVSRVA